MASTIFPIDTAEAGAEIKQLIQDKGIESLTSKIIRKHLEAKFKCTLSGHKDEVDRLTLEKIQEREQNAKKDSSDGESSSDNDVIRDAPIKSNSAKNKAKRAKVDSDENDDMVSVVKRRRACVVVKQRREPAAKKKKADPSAPNNRKGKSAFSRICVLSDDLSHILGQRYMRRSDVVKAMWAYFREHELLDPKDRRMVILNDALKKVFTGKRIQAFGMMKGLKSHIKDAEFLDDETRRQVELDLEAAGKNDAAATPSTSSSAKNDVAEESDGSELKHNLQSDVEPKEDSASTSTETPASVTVPSNSYSSLCLAPTNDSIAGKNGQEKAVAKEEANGSSASSGSSSADSSSSSDSSSDNE